MQPQLCPCLTLDLYFWWFNLCFENHNSGVHLWRLSIIQFWKPLTHNLRVRLQKYIFLTPLYVEPETNTASFCFLVRVFLSCTSAYWVTISYLTFHRRNCSKSHINVLLNTYSFTTYCTLPTESTIQYFITSRPFTLKYSLAASQDCCHKWKNQHDLSHEI